MRGRSRRVAVVGLALAVAALAVPSSAFGYAAFRTPGEAAYCGLSEGDTPHLVLFCWTPNDGFTTWMTVRGRSHKDYQRGNRGAVENLAPVLRFGRTWRTGSFVCHSRKSGLTCTNRRGHGWRLGRYVGYRLF